MPIPNIVWILPRPRRSRYKGGFPLHFEKKLIKLLQPTGLILHPFGGEAEFGIRVDIDPNVKPDILGDAHNLPFKDNTFNLVICDPPYTKEYASNLYNAKPAKYSQYIKEAVRVCEPGGYVVSYHWALTPRPDGTAYWCRIFIAGRVWHRPRVACVFRKEKEGLVLPKYREGREKWNEFKIRGVRELLKILTCPQCKGSLELEARLEKDNEVVEGFLYCQHCALSFPIEEGRPNFLSSRKLD